MEQILGQSSSAISGNKIQTTIKCCFSFVYGLCSRKHTRWCSNSQIGPAKGRSNFRHLYDFRPVKISIRLFSCRISNKYNIFFAWITLNRNNLYIFVLHIYLSPHPTYPFCEYSTQQSSKHLFLASINSNSFYSFKLKVITRCSIEFIISKSWVRFIGRLVFM